MISAAAAADITRRPPGTRAIKTTCLRPAIAVLALLAGALPARAQLRDRASPERLNRRLAGCVVDYTHNHGADRRLFSPILGMRRDLYVYLPPGYDPRRRYPLILYLAMSYVDEHALLAFHQLKDLDAMILRGEVPPVVVACPDPTYEGANRFQATHSLYVNGLGGRFEDHLVREVLPFLAARYAIRPEREAHAILGASAGGFGAAALAIKRRDLFGALAAVAAPLNMRYFNTDDDYREDFDPATYRWKDHYDPDEIVGIFYFGLSRVPARKYIAPVYGEPPGVEARIARDNPADLLFRTDLRPGELAIYAIYGGRDNWNFDAQDESFAWLAAQKGVATTLVRVPGGKHTLRFFRRAHVPAYRWLGRHLLPPTAIP